MGDIVIMLIICLLINLFMVFNTQSIVESISTMKWKKRIVNFQFADNDIILFVFSIAVSFLYIQSVIHKITMNEHILDVLCVSQWISSSRFPLFFSKTKFDVLRSLVVNMYKVLFALLCFFVVVTAWEPSNCEDKVTKAAISVFSF